MLPEKSLDATDASNPEPQNCCASVENKTRGEHFGSRSMISCKEPEVLGQLLVTILKLPTKYCIQVWEPYIQIDVNYLENV